MNPDLARSATRPVLLRNKLLCALSASDRRLLQPHLHSVPLPAHAWIDEPHARIRHVYFVEDGLVSVAVSGTQGRTAEVGLVGNEGMTGIPIVLGDDRSPTSARVQIGGRALRISPRELRKAMKRSASLRALLLRYVHAFLVQLSQTLAANSRANIDERLARWIVMAHDRVDGEELPLTHELLALMLGVRRAGVTESLNRLASEGLLRSTRGRVSVLDCRKMMRRAGGYYGVAEAEYRRLIGS